MAKSKFKKLRERALSMIPLGYKVLEDDENVKPSDRLFSNYNFITANFLVGKCTAKMFICVIRPDKRFPKE